MLALFSNPAPATWATLLQRPTLDTSHLETTVAAVLRSIQTEGDSAIRQYTLQFDKVQLTDLAVSASEIATAAQQISPQLQQAIQTAAANIHKFHVSQQEVSTIVETMQGVKCWRKSVGIEKVGLYIPGGTAPLFSTILMLGIPAQIAGCQEVVLCTPPDKNGAIHPAILYAADYVGIKKIFKIGGAQAIGAMTYGTASVPKVYKIFGPGNQYVTCAKQLVQKQGVAIDMPAGPSEVLVWADASCQPAYVAADLLSQAEHGADSQVILVSTDLQTIQAVQQALEAQVAQLPRKEIALKALQNSKAIFVEKAATALALVNAYAPEHLIMACEDAEAWANQVRNAGSIFLGNYSCESAGDYASGTNHTLPTNGYARMYSGVSLDSFVKKITFQHLSAEGLLNIGNTIEEMADNEQLFAHKNAVSLRLADLRKAH